MAGRFSIDRIDVGPDDLEGQLPLLGQLLRFIPGPDRPDYVLVALDRPVRHRTSLDALASSGVDLARIEAPVPLDDHEVEVRVATLVLAARMVGAQVHQGMVDLAVNIAFVLGAEVLDAEQLDFAVCLPVAVGFITDRDPLPPPA